MKALWGGQSETSRIRRLGLKHVRDAFLSADAIQEQWQTLNYEGPPDFRRALEEYDRLAGLISDLGIDIEWLPAAEGVGLDSLYVRDATVVCDAGVILGQMGKPARAGEPEASREFFEGLGVPVVGAIEGDGRLEGGDVVWLRPDRVAVGYGYRTNAEGIRQLARLLGEKVEVTVVPLPHWRGPHDVFHLMSILSPIDRDLALVYSPLMPVPFREWLLDLGFDLAEVPDQEFDSLGCNVLAVAPRRCVAVAGNPVTRRRLEAAGAEVHVFQGTEICLKGGGGPTCLTRPVCRETEP
jgi:N-dimethylarginine dimethylaminohydrolase